MISLFNDLFAGNSVIDKKYKPVPLLVIFSILIASVVVTNIIGTKIMTLWGFDFTAGVITYAMVFLATDILGEIWGKRTAQYGVLLGFVANLMMLIFIYVAIKADPAPYWIQNQESYANTLGSVGVIVLASMIAYLVSQLHDVWAFDFWRKRTKGEKLWLRNILSTITSQTIDTIIFIIVAFGFSLEYSQIFAMITGQIIVKWLLAIIDTPFIYLTKWLIGKPLENAHEY